ncbi:uncharacterized protein [Typha latifolia]|uniref:uncharacterized protein n=1 Tax=Typha latifolia TaxID=4733 RepID=UPI003C2DA9D6
MLTPSMGRHLLERNPRVREVERKARTTKSSMGKHLQRVYPLGMHKSSSSATLSSLSLSQNSNDSSIDSSISSWERKLPLSFRNILTSWGRRDFSLGGTGKDKFVSLERRGELFNDHMKERGASPAAGCLKRCNWITNFSDEAYISFHDECWGVPVYNDNRLFELLALSGMLIDHNWTEILKRRELYREAFAKFDYNIVAKMEENEILDISSNKELMVGECRVRCIVDNARCIQKVAKEFGSFSGYIWGHVNHKPLINKYKYPRSVPFRTPKSEAISKDLVRRGFRLVGPVIVYSFMQAAGMAIDHLVDCYRFRECVRIAERSWGMTTMAM